MKKLPSFYLGVLALIFIFIASFWSCNPAAVNSPPDAKTTQSTLPSATATLPAATTSPDKIPRTTGLELSQKMYNGAIFLLVDTRFPEEYLVDHITGAVSVPLKDITQGKWVPQGSLDQEIIIYCG